MRRSPDPDQITKILRQFQADLDSGLTVNQACRKAGIGITTYYRWKALQEKPVSQEQIPISELDNEVGRLKLLVAELALDRRMLQEALKKAMTSFRPALSENFEGVFHKSRLSRHAVVTRHTAQQESQGWFVIRHLGTGGNGSIGWPRDCTGDVVGDCP